MKLRMSKPALRRIVSGLGCMVLGAAIVVMPNIAAALDIGGIAQSLKNQFGFVGDLIGSAIFIAGIVVGPAGLFECYKATKDRGRSEEHTSELQSLMRISYAVFCLKKKHKTIPNTNN